MALALLGGCATMPGGPTVTVYPAPGKPFEVFQADDYACRQWALQQIGGASPSQSANQSTGDGAVLGAIVGAGLGAAIGAATGNPAAGAVIGGATGLVGGTAIGANQGAASGYQLQWRYDIAYQQCMYAKGNQIPGARPARAYGPPPPRVVVVPPPPRVIVVPPPPPPPRPAALLKPIYFDLNKSVIRPDAAETLKRDLEWFRQNQGRKVMIQGNCDPRATESYNLALGQRRAEAAKQYLVGLGVDSRLLETVSHGKDRPSCEAKDESCWAKERRVDFQPMP